MLGLTCISINRAPILSSLSSNTNPDTKPQGRRINTATPLQPPSVPAGKQIKEKKPSVSEIERAIGAGIYKDRDINRESEQEKTLFDSILSNSVGRTEGDVEKKLRETGEWIINQTEGPSRATAGISNKDVLYVGKLFKTDLISTHLPALDGKNILKVVFLWILPLWILSFLVASGVIKLPFISPFLDNMIM